MKIGTVSIIILNYNTVKYLLDCINSTLIASRNIQAQIIVVDNNSSDGSLEKVKSLYHNLLVISVDENVGFARANNKAITACEGEYVLLLNADTVMSPTGIEKMLDMMRANTRIGMLGPKLLMGNGSIDQACYRNLPRVGDIIFRLTLLDKLFPKSTYISHYNMSYHNPDSPGLVGSISGACMMLRRKAIEEVGYLDEQFFMYGEDLDWAKRFSDNGWLIYYFPEVTLVHFKRASTIQEAEKSIYYFYKSIIIYYKKHLRSTSSPLFDQVFSAFVYARMWISLLIWRAFKKWI